MIIEFQEFYCVYSLKKIKLKNCYSLQSSPVSGYFLNFFLYPKTVKRCFKLSSFKFKITACFFFCLQIPLNETERQNLKKIKRITIPLKFCSYVLALKRDLFFTDCIWNFGRGWVVEFIHISRKVNRR